MAAIANEKRQAAHDRAQERAAAVWERLYMAAWRELTDAQLESLYAAAEAAS